MKLGDILSSVQGAGYPYLRAADDWANEKLEYMLGPHAYKALSGASAIAREVTPAADFRDYADFGGDAVESALDGDFLGAAENAGWTGLASLGVFLPTSATKSQRS